MRKLLVALVVLILAAAAASHADIRRLMQAKGYAPANSGQCEGNCGGFIAVQDTISEPIEIDRGCTFPAAMPCVMD